MEVFWTRNRTDYLLFRGRGQHPQRLLRQAVNLRLRNFSTWVNSPENGERLPFSKTVFGSVFVLGSQTISLRTMGRGA